jgi:ArsR family transcriptional regulator
MNMLIYIYTFICIYMSVELVGIYQCLCDGTRLRIIHLLTRGPLCVCHFQEILGIPQTKVSQHLAYLRKKRMVRCTRHATWRIYSLPPKPSLELEANLKCLQDCAPTDKRFRADLKALTKVRADCGWIDGALENKPARRC